MNPLDMKPGEDSKDCLHEERQEEEGLSVDHRHQHHTDKCDNLQHIPESSQLLLFIKYADNNQRPYTKYIYQNFKFGS